MSKEYRKIIDKAPNPELADKIMCASYILAKGKPNVRVDTREMMHLVSSMTLEELKRNVKKIRDEKYK